MYYTQKNIVIADLTRNPVLQIKEILDHAIFEKWLVQNDNKEVVL